MIPSTKQMIRYAAFQRTISPSDAAAMQRTLDQIKAVVVWEFNPPHDRKPA